MAVPPPKNLDLVGLKEQAAFRLGRFLERQDLGGRRSDHLYMLAGKMVEELEIYSVERRELARNAFVELLVGWISHFPADIDIFPIFDFPPRNPWFAGRHQEVPGLRQRLCETGKTALGQAISGLGGIGKTQTAIEFGHRHRDQYDVMIWISTATDFDLKSGYGKVAKLLRLPHDPNDPDSVMSAVKRWLEGVDGRCWLLVFDNANDPPLLKPYLPSKAPNGHILITSRMRLDVLGIRSPLSIDKLPVEDSIQFLLNRADRAPGDEFDDRQPKNWPANSMDFRWLWSRRRFTTR